MSKEIKTDITTQEPPKSKRLSSFIWIGVLWVFVYLVSGLSGTGWTKMFNAVSDVFGLWPVTTMLLLAILVSNRIYQIIFRWAALLIFLSSLALLLILDANHIDQVKSILITEIIHWTTTGITLGYVALQILRKVGANK